MYQPNKWPSDVYINDILKGSYALREHEVFPALVLMLMDCSIYITFSIYTQDLFLRHNGIA